MLHCSKPWFIYHLTKIQEWFGQTNHICWSYLIYFLDSHTENHRNVIGKIPTKFKKKVIYLDYFFKLLIACKTNSAQFQNNWKRNEVAYEGHSFGDNLEPNFGSVVDPDLYSLLMPDAPIYLQGFMATAYSSLIAHMTDT